MNLEAGWKEAHIEHGGNKEFDELLVGVVNFREAYE